MIADPRAACRWLVHPEWFLVHRPHPPSDARKVYVSNKVPDSSIKLSIVQVYRNKVRATSRGDSECIGG